MLRWILLAIFAVGFVVAYRAAVKKREWGRPVMILCVVGLIAVVLHRLLAGGGPRAEVADIDRPAYESALALAQGVKAQVLPGSGIFIFSSIPPHIQTQMVRYWTQWELSLIHISEPTRPY